MVTHCAQCSEPITMPADGRLPPWCSRCGADLGKRSTLVPAPTAPAPSAQVPNCSASPAVGIAQTPGRSATISVGRNANPVPVEGFEESRCLAVHDFSLRGYLHKAGPGLLLIAIFVAIAGMLFSLALTRPDAGTAMPGVLMAGIAVALLVYVSNLYGKCIRRVEVFTDGIRWRGPAGPGRLSWTDVEAVYRSELILNGFKMSELKLVSRDGREVVFDLTIDRYGELAGLIQGCSAEVILPRKREEAGACGAEFGPILVGPVGVSLEGWLTPWEAVARYGISGGWLWVHFRGHGRKGLSLSSIPNSLVLLQLMGEFAPQPVREASGLRATTGS